MLAVMETCGERGKPSHMRAFVFGDVAGWGSTAKQEQQDICVCMCVSLCVCVNKEIYYKELAHGLRKLKSPDPVKPIGYSKPESENRRLIPQLTVSEAERK